MPSGTEISVAQSEDAVLSQVEYLKPDVLHLCAGVKGSTAFRKRLNFRCPGVQLMEAVGVCDESAVAEAVRISGYADTIILDSVDPNIAGIGAAGVTHDWNIDRKILETVDTPVILAGGLGPDNVAQILPLRPWGVDSLTRTSVVRDGVIVGKDLEKVKTFCRIIREYEINNKE